MKLKYSKDEDIQMIKFLVFRKEDPTTSKRTYMEMKSVAKFLGKSTAYVSKICSELRNGKHHDSCDEKPSANNLSSSK